MDKQITQVMIDKVSPILHKKEFIHLCQKHKTCPECGGHVKEDMMCYSLHNQIESLHGTGVFNCIPCGNKFKYENYK